MRESSWAADNGVLWVGDVLTFYKKEDLNLDYLICVALLGFYGKNLKLSEELNTGSE